jgi:4-alpha-glucanotransferase
MIPLFSAASTSSWGIGELPDVGPMARWLRSGGFDRLMLLPIGTMGPDETSPYSAASAMAIDPIYIGVATLPDFLRAGGVEALSEPTRLGLAQAQSAPRIQYVPVRRAKREALELAFDHFVREEWTQRTPRAAALAAYIGRERSWIDDYALFQALSETYHTGSWRDWPEAIRDRELQALDDVRRQLARTVLRHQYLQWIAETQWQEARAEAAGAGVSVFGDLPFMVNAHSADVWAHADEFSLDVSLGVPPDAFSATGQDWGLPTYQWSVMAARGFSWIRQRARRIAALFEGVRLDHLVGLYRTYGRHLRGKPFFSPATEDAQRRQGETVLEIFRSVGIAIIAEDLGTVPAFVRRSLARLGVPGCKVIRWEREWERPGKPFIDPSSYPLMSVAMTGTHDTDPLARWWTEADLDERRAVLRLLVADADDIDPDLSWNADLHQALLDLAYRSASTELFLPIQDAFGWSDRINLPGTVSEDNWTWRLPWPVDRLGDEPEAARIASICLGLARARGRGPVVAASTMPS